MRNGKGKIIRFIPVLLLSLAMLGACGAPRFRSEAELFAPAPEVIEELQPYFATWATTPPEITLKQRKEVGKQLEGVVLIGTIGPRTAKDGSTMYIVDVVLEAWGDWYRGYYYVHDGSDIEENAHLILRRVDEHLYIYNRTD